jgi:hypothetical protein
VLPGEQLVLLVWSPRRPAIWRAPDYYSGADRRPKQHWRQRTFDASLRQILKRNMQVYVRLAAVDISGNE